MTLSVFYALFLLAIRFTSSSHALEFQGTTHYDNTTLYEKYVTNIQYSPLWNKVIALHRGAVTILDLNTAPPPCKILYLPARCAPECLLHPSILIYFNRHGV